MKKFLVIPILIVLYVSFWTYSIAIPNPLSIFYHKETVAKWGNETYKVHKWGDTSFILTGNKSIEISNNEIKKSKGRLVKIGMGMSTSVSVSRSYLFGLARLPAYPPVYAQMHSLFFNSMWILLFLFIIMEIYQRSSVLKEEVRRNI